ncbi:hypothetical protein Val02_05340 [Virgisporangium aliadipatigenens]|uniref:Uncharacterized protein n=1 Tax=Virgisporangium aliadipatigenens TaxID=741659 RepID=A0A8J4DNJ7_9ACTN|nr:hypothetical protein [Virgisporangium aliadipatigenens]GIJ43648.1 hypothetical protein Val02_05340 [Virgisporangium aliadipatigenens]
MTTTAPIAPTAPNAQTDVKTRVAEGTKRQAERVQESVRQQPRRWAGAGAGVVALAAAAAGATVWQRSRNKPRNRAARVWQAVTSRFGR